MEHNRIRQANEDSSQRVEVLRQDHARLCGELETLRTTPPSWQTLRTVCTRLSLELIEHIRREERILGVYDHSLGAAAADMTTQPKIHHYGDYRYLQVITRSITLGNRPFLLNSRYQLLTDFLVGLSSRLSRQETELFPADDPGEDKTQ